MGAWRGWYHISGTTYGNWLPGDPRGWRSKKHKRHVEGDYHNPPPPGTHDGLLAHSAGKMKGPAVRLTRAQRRIAAEALVEMLHRIEIEVLVLAVDAFHFHGLARFPTETVRLIVGRAKKHATFILQAAGHAGCVWAAGSHPKPIRNRAHQLKAFRYILAHREKGAFVWTFHDPPPQSPR